MPTTTIPGEHGDFEVDLRPETGSRDEVTIRYKPKHDANGCKDIHLLQVVRTEAYDAQGRLVSRKDEDIFQQGDFAHTRDDRTCMGEMVDHLACDKTPYYADHWDDGDATTDPPSTTELDDGPWVGDDEHPFGDVVKPGIAKVRYVFETCAVCKATGAALDCMSWSSESTAADKGDITVPEPQRAKPPSRRFMCAVKRFTRNHTKLMSEDGVLHWYCPDVVDEVQDSDGEPISPWGEPVGRAFARRWISWFRRALARYGSAAGRARQLDLRIPWDEPAAEAAEVAFSDVLVRGREEPGRCVLKVTWAGRQRALVRGVVFTPWPDVTGRSLSPFVPRHDDFRNDAAGLDGLRVADAEMVALLDAMRAVAESAGGARGPEVRVAAIAGFDLPAASSAWISLDRATLAAFCTDAARREAIGHATRAALHYLFVNLGR